MKRSEIRDRIPTRETPDYAALHPGYKLRADRITHRHGSSGARADLALDAAAEFSIRRVQIVASLKVDPKTRRGAEIAREAECRIGGNAAAAQHDIVEPRPRHLDGQRERIDADFQWLQEIVTQDFTRMDERQPLARGDLGKIDSARIQIVALDAHRLILRDTLRSLHSCRIQKT